MELKSSLIILSLGTLLAASSANAQPCGAAAGTRFNLEPRDNPLPQNGTAVDFLPGAGLGGSDLVVGAANDMRALTTGSGSAPDFRGVFGVTSQTGFYVHRNGSSVNPCTPDLEGGIGPMVNPITGNPVVGVGFPAVAAHAATQSVFVADTRAGVNESAESGVGIFRSTAATLNDSSLCPDGTMNETQSAQCWPVRTLVNIATGAATTSSPHIAVDDRPGSAGDVYVVSTRIGSAVGTILLVACRNDLSACSAAVNVSGVDNSDLARVAVRPDGGVTVTYAVYSGGAIGVPAKTAIKYATCVPRGAPIAPVCAAAVQVSLETQAIPFNPSDPRSGFDAAQFVMHTFPKHVHRQDTNGIETYVVWERCKVPTAVTYPGLTFVSVCPDADLVMAASADNGQTWVTGVVDTGPQDQYQAALSVDPATNVVNIAYYSSQTDPLQHKAQVLLRQIPPGAATPDPVGASVTLTTLPVEPSGDSVLQGIFIGHFIGIASRANRAYVHYMHTAAKGTYNGAAAPEQNNHLGRADF